MDANSSRLYFKCCSILFSPFLSSEPSVRQGIPAVYFTSPTLADQEKTDLLKLGFDLRELSRGPF